MTFSCSIIIFVSSMNQGTNSEPRPATYSYFIIGWQKSTDTQMPNFSQVIMFFSSPKQRLLKAAKDGDKEEVERLLANYANVNAKNRQGSTPLHLASEKGNAQVVDVLIANGADIHAKNKNGMTPLFVASENGFAIVVEALIAHGADVNTKNNKGKSPLHAASFNGHVGVVSKLLNNGADVNAIMGYGVVGGSKNRKFTGTSTPLHHAKHKDTAEVLIAHGADVNAKADLGSIPLYKEFTPLHVAIHDCCFDVVKVLIANGANVNATTATGRTPLHWASDRHWSMPSNIDVINELIENGAVINAKDGGGVTPLHYASRYGSVNAVETLISNGADTNAKDNKGKTPLGWADERSRGNPEYSTLTVQDKCVINMIKRTQAIRK